jgi:uncharacterized protein (DUF2236 family)
MTRVSGDTGSEGYFDRSSMVRMVHREQILALYGARALLMQATHPVAFAGLLAHTGSIDDPYRRLNRTASVMNTITFGSRTDADQATRQVRAMHRRVTGVLALPSGRFPAGTPYAADDPELLLWILACLVDSGLFFYERYVRGLSRSEREGYYQDYRLIGRLFGLPLKHSPRSIEDFDDYMRQMLTGPDLHVGKQARQVAKRIVLAPPVPLAARPLLQLANLHIIGSLPDRLRRQYRLGWDPARELALRGGSQYAKRVLVPLLPHRLRYVSAARAA